MLSFKSLKLDVYAQAKHVSRASGFILREKDQHYLYTCWHIVTGVDFLDPFPKDPPLRRTSIKVHLTGVEARTPEFTAIGGAQSFDLALYDENGNPIWQQEPNARDCPDLEAIGLHAPKFADVVKVPLAVDESWASVVSFGLEDIEGGALFDAGTDVLVFGYPYGYSAMEAMSPEPTFIKRAIASNRISNACINLLDGPGAPGMSGAPVIIRHKDRWWLYGVYNGVIFPDHQHGLADGEPDRRAALGWLTRLSLARAFMGNFD